MTTNAFEGFVPLTDDAKDGEGQLVGNPSTGDIARAKWTGDMWAYSVPGTPEQLDFEPTHYRPVILV